MAAGNNRKGQLGMPGKLTGWHPIPNVEGVTAIASGNRHAAAICNGMVYTWGEDAYG